MNKLKKEFDMRKLSATLIAAVITLASLTAFAHSGGTDSKGCHRNHTTGGYHCH
uniref:YHYH domain-containing protein n=1 Tax=Marinobacterium profundum TaxID=1714300 RepID=UPI000AFE68BF|nr:YHYH domain-containing protein [Marinobacterium profundum]